MTRSVASPCLQVHLGGTVLSPRDAKSAESPTHCRYGDDVAHCPVMTWHMARGGAGVDVLLAPRV